MNISAEPTGRIERGGEDGGPRITLAELQEAIRAAEPRALLVWPRILRRVIKEDRQLADLTIRLPHRKSYVVAKESLLWIVSPDELGLDSAQMFPDRVILLPQPSEEALAERPGSEILLYYWRLLFHARIHLELDERVAAGRLTTESVRERIRQIGPTEFEEIRAVLTQEAFLLPPRDELGAYAEFSAVYWELRHFAQSLLPRYFPSIEDFRLVETVLAEDVDAGQVFLATHLAGAPDPKSWAGTHGAEASVHGVEAEPAATPEAIVGWERKYRRLIRRAERAAAVGNLVRSAICRAAVELVAPPKLAAKARTALKRDVDRLVRRLQVAMGIEDEDPQPWQETLLALARRASSGIWTVEARLLYDLQKVCIEHERGIYRVDLLGWVRSLGRQPVKRPLPAQREAAISKHLRSAARRLPLVRLTDFQRQRLSALLETATHRAEIRLRDRLRPTISRAVDEVGLHPQNLPEKVAFRKLAEEMLDRIVEYGHLTMGDLRDAISRNNLKLPDFSWRSDLLGGDPLLRADHRLAASLDGVYRGGEFYLRWMQRLSSFGFGTAFGRLVTRYLVVPYGGAFLIVTFLDHEIGNIRGTKAAAALSTEALVRIFLLGTFLLGIVNHQGFRRLLWQNVVRVSRAVRNVVVGLVEWFRRWEWLQRLIRSRAARLAYRFVLKPLAITVVAWIALPLEAVGWGISVPSGAVLFLAVNLFLNSRLGREVEEVLVDGVVQAWRRLGLPIVTGLFYLVVDVFRGILETVERLLYSVDEWLRFRSGETRLTFATKAVLGAGWSLVTYVLRFCINLLIEPQVNPIKHFPVVTVSHKLLWLSLPYFAELLMQATEMGKERAYAMVAAVIWCIPGIFGYLVWELKENWRLYAANRSRNLQPAMVGHHGETMVRLLRTGFHSGTVPKLFAKLRRAERRALARGMRPAAHKQLRAVRQVQLAVRRFVDRELVELVHLSPAWQAGSIALGPLRFGTNRIHLALEAAATEGGPLEISFEMRSGWLVAGIVRPGWSTQLSPGDRQVMASALVGFYKLAGADLIRQQVDAQLPYAAEWDVAGEGLLVAPQGDMETEVFYALTAEGPIEPELVRGELWRTMPTLEPRQVLFSLVPVRWAVWVAFWQQGTSGPELRWEPMVPIQVLP